MPVSLNILGMPQPDVTQLLNWIAAARPKFVLVMDNPDLATRRIEQMWYNSGSTERRQSPVLPYPVSLFGRPTVYLDVTPTVWSVPVKVCTKCGEAKPITEEYFRKANDTPDGRHAACKACDAVYRQANRAKILDKKRQHYAQNREEILAKQKEYQRAHAKERSEYKRKWAEANRERKAETNRRWREVNRERKAASTRNWYQSNRERADANIRKWRLENPDKVAEYNRRWDSKNPEAGAMHSHTRRARVHNAEGKFTKAEVRAIRAAQTDKRGRLHCWWCGKPVEGTPQLDHKIALAVGGTNDAANLCYACPTCNRSKGTKSPAEFAGRLL